MKEHSQESKKGSSQTVRRADGSRNIKAEVIIIKCLRPSHEMSATEAACLCSSFSAHSFTLRGAGRLH